jgi:hypothetical protein
MGRLSDDIDVMSEVDWLTEAVRRYSDASNAARLFSSVNMNNPMRLEKVRFYSHSLSTATCLFIVAETMIGFIVEEV